MDCTSSDIPAGAYFRRPRILFSPLPLCWKTTMRWTPPDPGPHGLSRLFMICHLSWAGSLPFHFGKITMSTRRLSLRFSAVSLGTMGWYCP